MRNARCTSLAAFASLFLLASTTATAPSRTECLQNRAKELALLAACGDEGSLNHCLSHVPAEFTVADADPELLTAELERCFHSAGCTPDESKIEAYWALRRCDETPSDLRRRHPNREGLDAAAMPLAREAAPFPGITIIEARQQRTTTTEVKAPEPTTQNSQSSPSPCFTTTTINIRSCPIQTTGADIGKKLPCFDTTATPMVCAEGLICQVDSQGAQSCMYKQSKPDTGGIVIAIFFAASIFLSVCSVCFFCCRERREQRRLMRAEEAAKIAQEAKTQALLNAKKASPGVSAAGMQDDDGLDRQPLMASTGGNPPPMPPMPQQYGAGPGEFAGGNGQPHNPFADTHEHPMR